VFGSRADRPERSQGAVRDALVGAIGVVVGVLPHALHHISLLAGTALVAGSGGTALFGAIGLLASMPFLLGLRRRFNTWRAPAVGLLVFVAMFSLSSFVAGPALTGGDDDPPARPPSGGHTSHH